MSRFFAASSSESETESSEDEVQVPTQQRPQRFAHFSESESEDDVRIVKSASEKRQEALAEITKRIKNHKKNKDMATVLSDFEDLIRAYEKNSKIDTTVPSIFIRTIIDLEDFANTVCY